MVLEFILFYFILFLGHFTRKVDNLVKFFLIFFIKKGLRLSEWSGIAFALQLDVWLWLGNGILSLNFGKRSCVCLFVCLGMCYFCMGRSKMWKYYLSLVVWVCVVCKWKLVFGLWWNLGEMKYEMQVSSGEICQLEKCYYDFTFKPK